MEEARDHRGDSAVAVVDKGIQDTRLALLRDHVEVGNGRRDQRTMACFQQVCTSAKTSTVTNLSLSKSRMTPTLPSNQPDSSAASPNSIGWAWARQTSYIRVRLTCATIGTPKAISMSM